MMISFGNPLAAWKGESVAAFSPGLRRSLHKWSQMADKLEAKVINDSLTHVITCINYRAII